MFADFFFLFPSLVPATPPFLSVCVTQKTGSVPGVCAGLVPPDNGHVRRGADERRPTVRPDLTCETAAGKKICYLFTTWWYFFFVFMPPVNVQRAPHELQNWSTHKRSQREPFPEEEKKKKVTRKTKTWKHSCAYEVQLPSLPTILTERTTSHTRTQQGTAPHLTLNNFLSQNMSHTNPPTSFSLKHVGAIFKGFKLVFPEAIRVGPGRLIYVQAFPGGAILTFAAFFVYGVQRELTYYTPVSIDVVE